MQHDRDEELLPRILPTTQSQNQVLQFSSSILTVVVWPCDGQPLRRQVDWHQPISRAGVACWTGCMGGTTELSRRHLRWLCAPDMHLEHLVQHCAVLKWSRSDHTVLKWSRRPVSAAWYYTYLALQINLPAQPTYPGRFPTVRSARSSAPQGVSVFHADGPKEGESGLPITNKAMDLNTNAQNPSKNLGALLEPQPSVYGCFSTAACCSCSSANYNMLSAVSRVRGTCRQCATRRTLCGRLLSSSAGTPV